MARKQLFAIGDIHGCALELEQLLASLPLDEQSTIVFLGDYIDRGPNSRRVVDLILDLKQKYSVVTLKGNHEAMFNEFQKDPSSSMAGFFVLNGGSATLASYDKGQSEYDISAEHLSFFKNLDLFYETEDFFFVHAGVPNVALNEIDPKVHSNELLWLRKTFHESSFRWEKLIVHGHTPVAKPEVTDKRINIDTGCVFQGQLTAIELYSGELYQVNAQRDIPHTFLKENPQISRAAKRFVGTIPVLIENGSGYDYFQTINYNEFGLLICETSGEKKSFEVGQVLRGKIGKQQEKQIDFVGQVVRHHKNDKHIAYGIKMIQPLEIKT